MTEKQETASGRVVIVTGGGTGIGKEIARAFAEVGDRVVICGRTLDALAAAAEEIGHDVTALVCDVGDNASVVQLVEGVTARFGRIDVLVNNAGIYGPIGTAADNDVEAWIDTIRINLIGTFLPTRRIAPIMIRQGSGSIINLSGGGATAPKPRYSAYAASKAGVVRFTETVAAELAEHGVRVNAIAPGFVATRFHDLTLAAGDEAGAELAATQKKMEQGGDDPRQAAALAVMLAGPEMDGVTGRLFSAVFDDWGNEAHREQVRASGSLYTLRRIDDFMFQEIEKK